MKKAIIIYGPPGAGKGTQANLLAWSLGYIHFDTGKFIEQIVHDPALQKDRIIQRERKNFDSGNLATPSWVLKIITQKTKEIARAGLNIVYSGSPRTLYEAFGDAKHKGLINILEKEYGKKNIIPILLKIEPEVSIQRNSKRLTCSVCKTGILGREIFQKHMRCPICDAPLIRRTVDNPAVFETRLMEYREHTLPILAALKKRGYDVLEIDAKAEPYKIHQVILKKIKLKA